MFEDLDLSTFYFLSSASSSNLKTINAFLIFSGAVGVSEFDSKSGFKTVPRFKDKFVDWSLIGLVLGPLTINDGI